MVLALAVRPLAAYPGRAAVGAGATTLAAHHPIAVAFGTVGTVARALEVFEALDTDVARGVADVPEIGAALAIEVAFTLYANAVSAKRALECAGRLTRGLTGSTAGRAALVFIAREVRIAAILIAVALDADLAVTADLTRATSDHRIATLTAIRGL